MSKIGVKGGMSLSTGFDVYFEFSGKTDSSITEFYSKDDQDVIHMLCDEAQLPNVQSGTAGMNRYLGEGLVQYPHTRIFTDVSLGFMCDAQMTPYKFFNNWYNQIYGDDMVTNGEGIENAKTRDSLPIQRVNRMKYMDEYVCKCKIMKTEPDAIEHNNRVPIVTILENCYPYAIDAVPLQYGSSQVTRVNVNFYYSRHTVSYQSV